MVAGPLCSRVMADAGAEVIKVESRRRLDTVRQLSGPVPPGKTGVNVNGEFNNVNTSKLSVTLDLTTTKGRQLAHELVAISDVVIDNFRTGVMESLGLGYPALARIRPDIIAASIPLMASGGRRRAYRGFGNHLQASSGMDELTGFPHRPPSGTSNWPYPDSSCNAFHTLTALMAALLHRNQTGMGQRIEIGQYESTIAYMGVPVMEYLNNRRGPPRNGNRHAYAAPHGVYRCLGEDRWVAIAVFVEQEWRDLVRTMGEPSWAKDARFSTLSGRKANEDELDALMEAWTAQLAAEGVTERLQGAGVAAGIVATNEDLVVRDAHLRERGYLVSLDHPESGRTLHDGAPFRFSDAQVAPRAPAPLLGQHNDAVFHTLLGLSEQEIDQLIVQEVIV